MRVTKRLMAALLACLMLLSLLPVPAYAADDGRIALLAVAQDGYVIEPEYIGYRSGDTVKDVLKNSSFRWVLLLPVTWPRRPERSPGR